VTRLLSDLIEQPANPAVDFTVILVRTVTHNTRDARLRQQRITLNEGALSPLSPKRHSHRNAALTTLCRLPTDRLDARLVADADLSRKAADTIVYPGMSHLCSHRLRSHTFPIVVRRSALLSCSLEGSAPC
jgi:hypothetical protein